MDMDTDMHMGTADMSMGKDMGMDIYTSMCMGYGQ
jgi:hypothetical protein